VSAVTNLSCRCGKVHIEAIGAPILCAECCCTSCRQAAAKFRSLPHSPETLTPDGGIAYVLQRKDRVRIVSGLEHLREFRLSADSSTRRVIATCCNTPIFLEFKGGHWLSLYAGLWPDAQRPLVEMRTMTSDLADPATLPSDVPNMKTQGGTFMFKLLWAWIAMGLRTPKLPPIAPLSL
jgi:hypothetical protein